MLRKVVFLDRDGVINRDSEDYVKNWSEFEFIPGSLDAISRLASAEFTVFVITNQSAINRKIVQPRTLEYIHSMMKKEVELRGGGVTDIFYCPHIPEDKCGCRKPEPGLILEAKRKYDIDLYGSCMVGDSVKDIECAKNAGCRHAVLVKTGHGEESMKQFADKIVQPDFIGENLFEAVEWIIARFGS